jgi:hypothetical protein
MASVVVEAQFLLAARVVDYGVLSIDYASHGTRREYIAQMYRLYICR